MTYQQAIEEAIKRTNKEIDKRALRMLAEYDQAYRDSITELNRIWTKYLATKDPQDYYNIMIRYGRLDNLLTEIQGYYNRSFNKVKNLIYKTSAFAMTNRYNLERYLTNWIVPEYGAFPLNEKLIELTITGTQESWKAISKAIRDRYNLIGFTPKYGTLSDLLFRNKKVELTAINSAVTQSFLQGKTYRQMIKDIRDAFDTTKYNAIRIAQTEGNRCGNAGAYANMIDAQAAGVDMLKFWIATLDTRTRDRHQGLDVKYNAENAIPVDKPFEIAGYSALYPGEFGVASMDINCRCSTGTTVNGQNPAQLRRGRNPVPDKDGKYRNEVFNYQDYDQWAKQNNLI